MREPSVSHDSRRSQARSERRHSRCRILIVDSRQRFDSLLHRELRNSGFDAVLQTNGWAEAAMMLRDQSFDVVLAYTPGLRGSEGRFDFFSGSPSLDTIFGEVRDGSHGALHASVDARQLVSAVAAAAARAGAVVQHSRASREMMPVANAAASLIRRSTGGRPTSSKLLWPTAMSGRWTSGRGRLGQAIPRCARVAGSSASARTTRAVSHERCARPSRRFA